MMSNVYKDEWEQSYKNRDNFLFYPNEEVIRFISKYIRKRVDVKKFVDIYRCYNEKPKMLDLGCGIGRHVIYGHEMGFESYGIDLSDVAIKKAKEFAVYKGYEKLTSNLVQGDIQTLPWPNNFFDIIISHGVLDSMHFSIAKIVISEVHRVLKPDGYFYCDLISGDDSKHAREYAGEEVIKTKHEKGTIQSYFNYMKIKELIDNHFLITEAILVRREDIVTGNYGSRYHLVLQKTKKRE